MSAEEADLEQLNQKIADAENAAIAAQLEQIIGDEMGFRRANGAVAGKRKFLAELKPGGDRRMNDFSILFRSKNRVVIQCVVMTGGKRYHNLRLFVRAGETQPWQLIGWANEELA